jgi:hypothetical protein
MPDRLPPPPPEDGEHQAEVIREKNPPEKTRADVVEMVTEFAKQVAVAKKPAALVALYDGEEQSLVVLVAGDVQDQIVLAKSVYRRLLQWGARLKELEARTRQGGEQPDQEPGGRETTTDGAEPPPTH